MRTQIISSGGKGKAGFSTVDTDTNDKVKASATDTTTDYLDAKITAGDNIFVSTTTGSVKTIRIDNTAPDTLKVLVDVDDTPAGYLADKLVQGSGINLSVSGSAPKTITISASAVSETYKVKADTSDYIPDYLINKVTTGTGISIALAGPGLNIVQFSSLGMVNVKSPGTPDYLENKIAAGTGISLTNTNSLMTVANTLPETYKIMYSASDTSPDYLVNKILGETVGVTISTISSFVTTFKLGGFTDDTISIGTATGGLESSTNLYNTTTGLGIGIAAPDSPIHVYKNAAGNNTGIIRAFNAAMDDGNLISAYIGRDTSTENAFVMGYQYDTTAGDRRGYFGLIGKNFASGEGLIINASSTIYTTYKMAVGQTTLDANYQFQLPNNSGQKGRAYAWDTYSDERIKTNVSVLNYGLNELLQVIPRRYDQHNSLSEKNESNEKTLTILDTTESKKNTIGIIAQELNSIIPEAVNIGNDKELWGIDYNKLIPVLIKSIQELNAKIESIRK